MANFGVLTGAMGAGLSSKRHDERRAPMLANEHGSIAMSVITQARVVKHERMAIAYEMIVTSAAVLGGFAINAAVDTIDESDFGNQVAFDAYAVLLVASSVLDLYAMVTLVVNVYVASRAHALSTSELEELEDLAASGDAAVKSALARLEQRTAQRRGEFVHRSRFYRSSAVTAFIVSLPCFLGALASKQFSVQTKQHSLHKAASPPPTLPSGVPLVEPFTTLRWSLAILVLFGTCAVLLSVLGQIRLLRVVRRTL